MNRATRQRGMIHVEGLSHPELESSTTTKPPHSQPTDRYGPSGELPSPTKELKRTSFRFRNLFAAMATILLLLWIVYMFRYDVMPVGRGETGVVQYIVRDRWTSEIEVVWQAPNGEVRRKSRYPFE